MTRRVVMLLALWLPALAASPTQAEEQAVRISAGTLEADASSHRVSFKGEVSVEGKDLAIRCDRLLAEYGPQGELTRLRAEGNLKLVYRDLHASADAADVDLLRRVIVLSGRPSAEQGGARIEGERIELDLADGKMEVKGVHGVFRIR